MDLLMEIDAGNCFFRAVSRMVYNDDSYNMMVCDQAIRKTEVHREEFIEFFDSNDVYSSFKEYFDQMSRAGHLANNLITKATNNVLQIETQAISSSYEYVPIMRPLEALPTQTLFLGHIVGLHYVSTTSPSIPQIFRYGSESSDCVVVEKTIVIDNIVTWVFNLIQRENELKDKLAGIKNVLSKNFLVVTTSFFVVIQWTQKEHVLNTCGRSNATEICLNQ